MTQINFKKLTAGLAVFLFATGLLGTPAHAAKGDLGYDWASYQGTYGLTVGNGAKFAFSKVGGDTGSYISPVYRTQVQAGIARGLRMHSYLWFQDMTNQAQVDAYLDKYLPMVQTPKGSIVALDVESGVTNNDMIKYAMRRIKDAGYTPMFYSYVPFIKSHAIDIDGIGKEFGKYAIWIAAYPNNTIGQGPLFQYFPSMDNVGVWQYNSMGLPQGLDMNVDVSGDKDWSITENGYKNGNASKPETPTESVDAGKQADNTAKKDITVGMTVKVNFGATHYATGETIPQFVKGVAHKVLAVNGNKVLLADINSWMNRSDVEILDANKSAIDQFKQAGNKFTAYESFKVDKIAFVNGIWQAINYDLAGGTNANWTANGIPLAILDNVTRGNVAPTRVGDTVKFMSGYNHGTIDKYDEPSNGAGITEGSFGNVWYDANGLLTK